MMPSLWVGVLGLCGMVYGGELLRSGWKVLGEFKARKACQEFRLRASTGHFYGERGLLIGKEAYK